MTSLESFINAYLASYSNIFFIRQFVVIICLFIFGAVISTALTDKDDPWQLRCVMAYPLGICAFAATAYAMIVIGIPYNRITVCSAVLIEAAVAVYFSRSSYLDILSKKKLIRAAICAAVVLVTAFIAVSGIAPVIISNDTMYFYRRYPDCIVYFEGLRDQFDFWMTDTGLGAVAVDTLPALFGFGESFGIREFFHLNFIAFFGMCVFEKSKQYLSGRNRVVAAVAITLVLVASTPFVILGHWALANMYFMELFLIAAYYTYMQDGKGIGASALLLVALALFRIEGTMFVVWLIICLAVYRDIGKKLAGFVLVPVIVLFGGYCIKIFTGFYLFDNIYLFLTPQKAVLLIGAIAFSAVYIAFVQPKLPKALSSKLSCIYIGAMILGNLVLLVYDSEHYIGNIKAFGSNLFRQSGWGMLPYFVISAIALFGAEFAVSYKNKKIMPDGSNSFNSVLTAGFILIVVAAAFGRGDILMEDVGDSGNRVLLQVTPLIVMTFGELGMNLVRIRDEM